MAISSRDKKLLAAFPRPPTGRSSPSQSPLPSPDPIYRASDFGFIRVGLSQADDSDSLYEDPPEKPISTTTMIPPPTSLASPRSAELQLVLDNPSRLFSPSETITGYVVGWNPESTSLRIILEGRAKTYIYADKIPHKDRAPLLYQTYNVAPSAEGGIPRFSITVPEKTTGGLEWLDKIAPDDAPYGKYWSQEWPAQEPYESKAEHPLPPSMSMPLRNAAGLVSRVAGWGTISYELIAVRSRLDPTTGKMDPEASCQVPITLTTRRLPATRIKGLMDDANEFSSDLHVQTAALSKERRLSLREQLRDAFNSSAPAFYFSATVSTPKLSTPGSETKVTISVAVLPPPAGRLYNFAVPDISITRLEFRIRSYTGLRVLRVLPEEQEPSRTHTFKHYELRTSQSANNAVFKPKDGAFDGQSCVSPVVIPKTILPSFKTYNLWRSYRLECDITFSVAGKTVSTKTKSDLNIVAQPAGTADMAPVGRHTTSSEDDAAGVEIAKAMVRAYG